jgi:peroxiredoxin
VSAGRRYGWFLALAAAALIVYVSLNTLGGQHVGSAGLKVGTKVPPFAAPLALGPLGDAPVNVARKPNQGDVVGNTPACKVRGPGILNSCQLGERGPFVLAFLATRGTRCTRELDALQRISARHRDLQVAAISIRGDRDDLRSLVRKHGWRFPVAWDLDGRLANLFGVAVCPQLTYVLQGGIVHDTTIGELDARELDARLTSLERAARAKGWHP